MRKSRWLPWVRALLDALCLLAAVAIAYEYRFHVDRIPIPGSEPPAFGAYAAAAPVLALVFVATFAASGVYRIRRGRPLLDEVFSIIGASAVAGLITLALMSLYRTFSYSRLLLLYTVIVALILITINRLILRRILTIQRRHGVGTDRVLVVGTGAGSELLLHRMTMFPEYGYELIGVIDSDYLVDPRYLKPPATVVPRPLPAQSVKPAGPVGPPEPADGVSSPKPASTPS